MTVHDIRFVQNRVSFPDALMAVAERLFLSRGGSVAHWQRWQAAWKNRPVHGHQTLNDAEQLAMQDRAELAEFLQDDAAPAMFELLRTGTLAALIDGRAMGLFRANPSVFDDLELFHSLMARNASVQHVACSHIDNLFGNGFGDVASGRVVFRMRDITAALDTDMPMPALANDNPEPISQPVLLLPPPVEPPAPTPMREVEPEPATAGKRRRGRPIGSGRSWDRPWLAARGAEVFRDQGAALKSYNAFLRVVVTNAPGRGGNQTIESCVRAVRDYPELTSFRSKGVAEHGWNSR